MEIEVGKIFSIRVSKVSSYTVTMKDGSVISGLITPNNPLTCKSEGSIIDIEVLDQKVRQRDLI